MKPMIWHPEPQDEKVNQYLDRTNREPWVAILGLGFLLMLLMTTFVLLGAF
jgi:hypothetical protein